MRKIKNYKGYAEAYLRWSFLQKQVMAFSH